MSVYFDHCIKADKKENLKLKISNANTVVGICTNKGDVICLSPINSNTPYTLENSPSEGGILG